MAGRPLTFTCTSDGTKVEASIVQPEPRLATELSGVFPHVPEGTIRIVPVFLQTRVSLVGWDNEAEEAKEASLARFMSFASAVRQQLLRYFCDFTDPSSGFPMYSERVLPYTDLEGIRLMFPSYPFENVGECEMMMHPRFGPCVYPATIFTTAPVPAIEQALVRAARTVLEQ
jgi:hypothetical protein